MLRYKLYYQYFQDVLEFLEDQKMYAGVEWNYLHLENHASWNAAITFTLHFECEDNLALFKLWAPPSLAMSPGVSVYIYDD